MKEGGTLGIAEALKEGRKVRRQRSEGDHKGCTMKVNPDQLSITTGLLWPSLKLQCVVSECVYSLAHIHLFCSVPVFIGKAPTPFGIKLCVNYLLSFIVSI